MKLSISNIGWDVSHDTEVYAMMQKYGFTGLEIAPTRIFPEAPYDVQKRELVKSWAIDLKKKYGFDIPSMQSIWYGRQEKLFGSEEEREQLLSYTKKAIDFAKHAGIHNLVFGCPRNRVLENQSDWKKGVLFFQSLGAYAVENNTVVGMEANPPIYNTNYINTTKQALALIDEVASEGFKLNFDMGTMIENKEEVSILSGQMKKVNHVHISEPGLKVLEKRTQHQELAACLKEEGYQGFVSIEMGKVEDMGLLENTMGYIAEVFGNR